MNSHEGISLEGLVSSRRGQTVDRDDVCLRAGRRGRVYGVAWENHKAGKRDKPNVAVIYFVSTNQFGKYG